MTLCDYQILEYTTSELQSHGIPFIVVVCLHEPSSYALTIFIVRQWKTKIESSSKDEIEEIQLFLEDLRLQNNNQAEIVSLFERLAHLNVGPIRTGVSGSCPEQDLNEVIEEYFDEARGASSWKDHFINVT
jgi:hypothetical protein